MLVDCGCISGGDRENALTVEVWARIRLDDGEAEEKVARRDPAFHDNVPRLS